MQVSKLGFGCMGLSGIFNAPVSDWGWDVHHQACFWEWHHLLRHLQHLRICWNESFTSRQDGANQGNCKSQNLEDLYLCKRQTNCHRVSWIYQSHTTSLWYLLTKDQPSHDLCSHIGPAKWENELVKSKHTCNLPTKT